MFDWLMMLLLNEDQRYFVDDWLYNWHLRYKLRIWRALKNKDELLTQRDVQGYIELFLDDELYVITPSGISMDPAYRARDEMALLDPDERCAIYEAEADMLLGLPCAPEFFDFWWAQQDSGMTLAERLQSQIDQSHLTGFRGYVNKSSAFFHDLKCKWRMFGIAWTELGYFDVLRYTDLASFSGHQKDQWTTLLDLPCTGWELYQWTLQHPGVLVMSSDFTQAIQSQRESLLKYALFLSIDGGRKIWRRLSR